tara:strand:- start:571 stop:1329 length:759 start_codon:yes stop_codon:yes gene_type:complete
MKHQTVDNNAMIQKLLKYLKLLKEVTFNNKPIISLQTFVSECKKLNEERKIAIAYYLETRIRVMLYDNGGAKQLTGKQIPVYVKKWISDARDILDSLINDVVKKIRIVKFRSCPNFKYKKAPNSLHYNGDLEKDAFVKLVHQDGRSHCLPLKTVIEAGRKFNAFNSVRHWSGQVTHFPATLPVPTTLYPQKNDNPFLLLQTRARRFNRAIDRNKPSNNSPPDQEELALARQRHANRVRAMLQAARQQTVATG